MTLEKIVDMFGSSIDEHLVSRRSEDAITGPFKGVKTYRIELWNVKQHCVVFDVEKTCQLNSENREKVIEELEEQFIKRLFDLCT